MQILFNAEISLIGLSEGVFITSTYIRYTHSHLKDCSLVSQNFQRKLRYVALNGAFFIQLEMNMFCLYWLFISFHISAPFSRHYARTWKSFNALNANNLSDSTLSVCAHCLWLHKPQGILRRNLPILKSFCFLLAISCTFIIFWLVC